MVMTLRGSRDMKGGVREEGGKKSKTAAYERSSRKLNFINAINVT